MKSKELRQKNLKEMSEMLIQNQNRLGRLKFDLAARKLKNIQEIKQLRRTIARIKTILKEDKNGQEK